MFFYKFLSPFLESGTERFSIISPKKKYVFLWSHVLFAKIRLYSPSSYTRWSRFEPLFCQGCVFSERESDNVIILKRCMKRNFFMIPINLIYTMKVFWFQIYRSIEDCWFYRHVKERSNLWMNWYFSSQDMLSNAFYKFFWIWSSSLIDEIEVSK